MTIAIKPTASGSTIEQNGSTILTVDGSGNIAIANDLSVTGSSPLPSGPAFSAYMSSSQSLTTITLTKVQFNTEDFDTDNCFDTSTYRFTPNVAGYYQVNGILTLIGTSGTAWVMYLYKNGSVIQNIGNQRSSGGEGGPSGSALVYMNGITDYLEMYTLVVATSPSIYAASSVFNKFQAHLVRAA